MGEEKIGNLYTHSPQDHKHQQAKGNEVFRKKKPLRGHSDERIKSVGDSWSPEIIKMESVSSLLSHCGESVKQNKLRT
jgi:hypothetical protein